MRVAIVSCVYPPEPVVSSRTSAAVASALATRGDSVTVIAPFPSRPAGAAYPEFRRRLFSRAGDNPRIIRCFAFASRSSTLFSRFLENASFGISAGFALLTTRKPDVVYSNTWPIFATALVRIVAAMRGVPVVISVQDLFPESLVTLGYARSDQLVIRALRTVDRWIARGCASLIVISERFAELYRSDRGVAEERLRVIPNWTDELDAVDSTECDGYREGLGVRPQERLVVFGGNIGVAAGLGDIIEAARQLTADDGLRIVIAGSGTEVGSIQAATESLPGSVVSVRTPWPREETALLMRSADVCLIPTVGDQSLYSVPSKLITALLAARPVIAVAHEESEVAATVRHAAAGWVVPPGDPAALCETFRLVAELPQSELIRMGQAGEHYARSVLSGTVSLPAVLEVLDRAVGRPV